MIDKEEISFEEALEKLEKNVERLESGELTLSESLEAFEAGVKLTRFCSNKLKQAEDKIEIIKENNGEIETVEYNSEIKE